MSPEWHGHSNLSILLPILLVGLVFSQTGCEELQARRHIQDGNEAYLEGQFSDAVQHFEDSIAKNPNIAIGRHNAGLAYYKLFRPGDESEANKNVALKASEHFQAYLEMEQDDTKVLTLLTNIWLDSGQYEQALAHWGSMLERDPKDVDVMIKLAGINAQAGRFDKAIEWHNKRAETETEPVRKADAYRSIGSLQRGRLTKPEVFDIERQAIADIGIEALQKAEALTPDEPQLQALYQSIYRLRALNHGATWAQNLEQAVSRRHFTKWRAMQKAAEEKAKQEAAAGGDDSKEKEPSK
jgi:tetratricopeptide (TPR) repeat protein